MSIYTQAMHPVYINGEKHYFICDYVSIIDISYKRYILI